MISIVSNPSLYKHTKMTMKSIILITGLVAILVATQAEAQTGLPLSNVITVNGNVSCSANASIAVNGSIPIPPFPNALVQVSCDGIARGSAITNGGGTFTIFPIATNLSTLLSPACSVVVGTPLSACNATLPSNGTLQAPLQFVENTVRGLLNVTTLVPRIFTLNVNITL